MAVAKRSTGITIHNDTYPFISPSRYRTSLSGKIVLVTGASRSIGRATCVAFARAGAHVAALARTASALDSLVSEITTQYGVQALAITGDVVGDAPGTIKRVEEGLGHIDILINNAGKSRMARFAEEKDCDLVEGLRGKHFGPPKHSYTQCFRLSSLVVAVPSLMSPPRRRMPRSRSSHRTLDRKRECRKLSNLSIWSSKLKESKIL
jgi:hypothetical protein